MPLSFLPLPSSTTLSLSLSPSLSLFTPSLSNPSIEPMNTKPRDSCFTLVANSFVKGGASDAAARERRSKYYVEDS